MAARLAAALRRGGGGRLLARATLPSASLRLGFRALAVSAGQVVEVPIPNMGDSISEGTILSILKKAGEYVDVEQSVAEVETDKVTVEAKSPHAGTIKEMFVAEGETVQVGGKFFSIEVGVGRPSESAPAPSEEKPSAPAAPPPPKSKPAPPAAAPAAAPAPPPAAAPADAPAAAGRGERREKMSRMRLTIARTLKKAQNELAQLTTFNEVDMTELFAMRKKYKDAFIAKHDVKLGFMSAFVMASAKALHDQPVVNAAIVPGGDEIEYRDYVNIGFAAATPAGLVVPVLRDADKMTLLDIEREMGRLAAKARAGKIQMADMAGSTYSITNGGVFGSLMSMPILTPPQSAILGMHGVFERPMYVEGEIKVRPMMYVALTYDHRLVDGREAVTFLKRIKELCEDPHRLLLDV